nr:aminoacylase-1 isoform X2 [Ipomoea batatas]
MRRRFGGYAASILLLLLPVLTLLGIPQNRHRPTRAKVRRSGGFHNLSGEIPIPGNSDCRIREGEACGYPQVAWKCVGLQYLEAIRSLKASGFQPIRTVYLSFVPDEEIGGHDGAESFAHSDIFSKMNVGIVLDEGLASPTDNYRAFYGERSPWWLIIKAVGAPGHGAKLYDNSAMENLFTSIESIRRFRAAQFDLVKAGLEAEGEVISVNMVSLKAGTPSPTGFVMNLQPSEAEAGFDIRVPQTEGMTFSGEIPYFM